MIIYLLFSPFPQLLNTPAKHRSPVLYAQYTLIYTSLVYPHAGEYIRCFFMYFKAFRRIYTCCDFMYFKAYRKIYQMCLHLLHGLRVRCKLG